MIFLSVLLAHCHHSSQTRKAEENLESLPRQPRTESKIKYYFYLVFQYLFPVGPGRDSFLSRCRILPALLLFQMATRSPPGHARCQGCRGPACLSGSVSRPRASTWACAWTASCSAPAASTTRARTLSWII